MSDFYADKIDYDDAMLKSKDVRIYPLVVCDITYYEVDFEMEVKMRTEFFFFLLFSCRKATARTAHSCI